MTDTKMTDTPMKRIACKKYETCSAPLCPLDEGSLKSGIWYPDEEVCIIRNFRRIPWVRKQIKIAKKPADVTMYFTIEMLELLKRVGKLSSGANPNIPSSETTWLGKHRQGIKKPLRLPCPNENEPKLQGGL